MGKILRIPLKQNFTSNTAAGQMRRAMPALIRKPLAGSKQASRSGAHAADRSATEALGTVHE